MCYRHIACIGKTRNMYTFWIRGYLENEATDEKIILKKAAQRNGTREKKIDLNVSGQDHFMNS
jgi:hypothetical protein